MINYGFLSYVSILDSEYEGHLENLVLESIMPLSRFMLGALTLNLC